MEPLLFTWRRVASSYGYNQGMRKVKYLEEDAYGLGMNVLQVMGNCE
jgi:hypothetical protein